MAIRIGCVVRAALQALPLAAVLALAAIPAQAFTIIGPCFSNSGSLQERTSFVLDSVSDLGAGVFRYRYEICNTSDDFNAPRSLLRDWELPFDGSGQGQSIFSNAAGIHNIVTPLGWEWSIERRGDPTNLTFWEGIISWQNGAEPDPWAGRFDDHEYVLHFWTPFIAAGCDPIGGGSIDEGQSCGGFGFDALSTPAAAPYQASWSTGPPRQGDPAFPATFPNTAFVVPLPGALTLLLSGLVAVGFAGRRAGRGAVPPA